jgi:hypothetical protein
VPQKKDWRRAEKSKKIKAAARKRGEWFFSPDASAKIKGLAFRKPQYFLGGAG